MPSEATRAKELLKVWLPGESPWAEVLSTNDDGTKTVRLDNKLAGDFTASEFRQRIADIHGNGATVEMLDQKHDYRGHTYRFNDIVMVRMTATEPKVWEVIGYAAKH